MNILRIGLCDLRRMIKNRRTLIFWLAMPVAFSYVFGLLFGNFRVQNTWVPVINLDRHELSRVFIDQLGMEANQVRSEAFGVDVRWSTQAVQVSREFREYGIPRAVIIPATFSADILSGTPAQCIFARGGRNGSVEQELATQVRLANTTVKFIGAAVEADLIRSGWSEATKARLLDALQKPPRVTVEKKHHSALRPPPSGFGLSLPSQLVMFVLMNSIMFGGISLVLERQNKQLIRLLAAPIRTADIFLGKLLGRMLQPALQGILLLVAGYFLMGVPLGDHPFGMVLVLGAFSLCCGGLSVLFGSICATEMQVSTFGMLAGMMLGAVGGCWWPIEMAPRFAQVLAMATPTYWALQGMHDVISFGKPVSAVWPECLILIGYAALFLAIAVPVFQKKQS